MPGGTIKTVVADRGFRSITAADGKDSFFYRSGIQARSTSSSSQGASG